MPEELNQSYQLLQEFDLDELEDVGGCVERWLCEAKEELKVSDELMLSKEKFLIPNKTVLSAWLASASQLMARQRDVMSNMQETIEALKTEALADKDRVIRLQTQLLEQKEVQLQSLQTTVKTTVQDTVQSEIRSYSETVKKTSGTASTKSLKSAVKSVVTEEDRSKNLIVYGLKEEQDELLPEAISEILSEIGEKPRFDVVRIGVKRPGPSTRPVKVSLPSSTAA